MLPMLIPALIVRGADRAIAFYQEAFGAVESMRLTEPGGRVGHAELRLGDSPFFVADEYPEYDLVGPETRGGVSCTLQLKVDDLDAAIARAAAAGARVLQPAKEEFYGERCARLTDPFGHVWSLGQRVEDVSPEEMQRRYDALMAG